jgi:hypothetical protein
MKTKKTFTILGLVFAFLIMLPVLRASEFDQATKFTFSQPVSIPGQVLPAGTYWFTVIAGFDPNVVLRASKRTHPSFRGQRAILWSPWPSDRPSSMRCS